jgi:hypothetical protein
MNSSWYPNTDLSAWTLALIAVVAVGTLTVWLAAVYLADRAQSKPARTASSAGPARESATTNKEPGPPVAGRRAA